MGTRRSARAGKAGSGDPGAETCRSSALRGPGANEGFQQEPVAGAHFRQLALLAAGVQDGF